MNTTRTSTRYRPAPINWDVSGTPDDWTVRAR
ncbi:MAG: hypothetical protein QOH72_2438 [Solirubrobacteraceae bacterium]|jgi:hypothetical protein|nr:hypothetical protein [Solirubrobacteraceae bacterium]